MKSRIIANKLLFDNETIITQSDGNVLTLTNLRLRYSASQWGNGHHVSLLLEKISSIEMHYRSRLIFIILAILAVAAGLIAGANGDKEYIGIGIGVGVVFVILFLFSRKYYLTISSYGVGKIYFHIKSMKREKVFDFINQLESAIKQRREELK
jgi:hypothetical protein